ncbi:MAG: hypothetical protein HYZ38_12990 [Mycobacterium sp.]|nr:hypothetical protein [Mycobacterium sp.]
MNRRQRRASGQRRPSPRQLEQYATCPDCDSTVSLVEIAPRVHQAQVQHDDTCPWFLAFQRNGGLGVRLIRSEDDQ